MKAASYLVLFSFGVFVSCKSQPKREDKAARINQLTTTVASDEFMGLFLQFVQDNKLAADLVNYEDELVQQQYLDGHDLKSFDKYFERIITEEEDKRCISKALAKKIAPLVAKFDYPDYKRKMEDADGGGTKEFNFLNYLKYEGNMWREALEEALKDNKLSTDKKYFYLFVTMPSKTCP